MNEHQKHSSKQKKLHTKDCILVDSIYTKFQKRQSYSDQKQVGVCRSAGVWGGGLIAKRHKGTLWGDGNVLYLDCGLGYLYIHVCQNSLNFTLKRLLLLYVKYTLIKVIF